MDELIEDLKSTCENKYVWELDNFCVVRGSLESKYGCGEDFVTCKTCKATIREFDVTADYIETLTRLKSLEEEVAQMGDDISELKREIKRLIKQTALSFGPIDQREKLPKAGPAGGMDLSLWDKAMKEDWGNREKILPSYNEVMAKTRGTGETGLSLTHSQTKEDETSWLIHPVPSIFNEKKEDPVAECQFKGVYGSTEAEKIRKCNSHMHGLYL